jgi:class 3 adenylate cyclase
LTTLLTWGIPETDTMAKGRAPHRPASLDTAAVTLDEGILELTELLAAHSHAAWARRRLDDGWRYGPERDDARKEHPGLVPYDELTESEKQYDRATALETLKAMRALGYRIQPPAGDTAAENDGALGFVPQAEETADPLAGRGFPGLLDLAAILSVWRAREPDRIARSPELVRRLGERTIELGEPLFACDVLAEGLEHWPDDVRLQQLLALALARSGATERANTILSRLRKAGRVDEETLGLLARTHKDFADRAVTPEERCEHLRRAYEAYAEAYRLGGGHWPGINAATLALVLGRADQAAEFARAVHDRCAEALAAAGADRYWLLATLGEAALILGEWSRAEEWYGQASLTAAGRFGDLSSTRRNARLIARCLGADTTRVDRWFHIPRVVVFAGHLIDRPERATPRFPAALEDAVRRALVAQLDTLDAGFGYASAGCGSDLLFLEAMLERSGEVHVVLPYEKSRFLRDSVDIVPGGRWVERCERVLQRATEVLTASEQSTTEASAAYTYGNLLVDGLATIRADQLGADVVPLAVWDGRPGDGPGGTASAVERWRASGRTVDVIDLAELLRRHDAIVATIRTPAAPATVGPPRSSAQMPSRILALLFADAVGFSRLSEEQIPLFVRHFLGDIAALVQDAAVPPVMKNTWGDGLFLVFPTVRDAGRFALDLCDRICETSWTGRGLPGDLSLRIALHAGPVYACTDPVTGLTNYIGTHVSRTARIEPITPPGHVYASRAFVALAAASNVRDFTCDYVGQTPLAKGYGTFPMYHVRRRIAGASAP